LTDFRDVKNNSNNNNNLSGGGNESNNVKSIEFAQDFCDHYRALNMTLTW